MKKYFVIFLSTLAINNIALSQTYVQGEDVIPVQSIAKSSVLNNSSRITIANAFQEINNFDMNPLGFTNSSQLAGEYFKVNNLLIHLVSRSLSTEAPSLEETQETKRGMYTDYMANESDPSGYNPNELNYYDTLKNVNNFRALVHYTYSGVSKRFIIIDNSKRYVIMGAIYCYPQHRQQAEAFVDTLLNSITFK